jgi:hypothetical protein
MKKFLFLMICIGMSFMAEFRADCGCCCCHQGTEEHLMCEADNATIKALLEEDPFGEPSADDLPTAPKEPIKISSPTASQALLQRVGCTVITGYLMCVDCLAHLWRKIKSLY